MTDMPALQGAPEPCPVGAPRITRTCYELRAIKGGKVTLLQERFDALSQAKTAATVRAYAMGFADYYELKRGESFADMERDGVYLTTVRIETVARPI
jgi:hypothetical protein